MASTSNILNEKNILKYSKSFQENKPFKFGFMENVFEELFYQELYNTYPKFDNSWIRTEEPDKSTYRKFWFNEKKQIIDKKRINVVLRRIKNSSKKYKASSLITERIWKLMIKNFIILENKLFKKPKK